jgi:hypothetical protein
MGEGVPSFSPDGKWLAYAAGASDVGGQVFVRAFPDNGGLWQISNAGGNTPMWAPNGHDLLYQERDRIMAVDYSAKGNTFVVQGKPRVWLEKTGGQAFGIHPDGKRMLVLAPLQTGAAAPVQEHEVVLMLNFGDYLRSKVPMK